MRASCLTVASMAFLISCKESIGQSLTLHDEEGRIEVSGSLMRSSPTFEKRQLHNSEHTTRSDDHLHLRASHTQNITSSGEGYSGRKLGGYPDCQGHLPFIGDGVCDRANNNEYCDWDGGDCCKDSTKECKDPSIMGTPNCRETDYAQSLTVDQKEWLDLHNEERKYYHGKYGYDYVPLVYSTYLETSAQQYANQLVNEYCEDYRHSGGDQGENLAVIWEGKNKPSRVMKAWSEQEEISPTNVPFRNGSGHWMQVIWRSSKYVGCAHQFREGQGKDGKPQSCIIYVCRYLSAGNCDRSNDNWLFDAMRSTTNCVPVCPPQGCYHCQDAYYESS